MRVSKTRNFYMLFHLKRLGKKGLSSSEILCNLTLCVFFCISSDFCESCLEQDESPTYLQAFLCTAMDFSSNRISTERVTRVRLYSALRWVNGRRTAKSKPEFNNVGIQSD